MPITFNSILQSVDIDPSTVRLLRHQDSRSMRGKKPYQLWRDNRPAFELYQSVQGFDGKPKLASAKYWASFLAMPNGETLFAGLYAVASCEVLETQMVDPSTGTLLLPRTRNIYTLHLAESLTDLIGKLVIDWGSGTRA